MKKLLAINLQVRCADGVVHDDVKLFVENNQRIYVAEDGSELSNVTCVEKCTAVVNHMALAAALYACEECNQ
jgi:hypothetical protein